MNINNEKFINKVNESGLSLKEICEKSGVSLKILSGLYNNKKNINFCNLITAIAIYCLFNCDFEDILNSNEEAEEIFLFTR